MPLSKLDVPKTVQALALLLKANDRTRLEYVSLLKVLYIADRESLADVGRPITGDVAVAMQNGPVLSGIYDLINATVPDDDPRLWTEHLHRDNYHLELIRDPGVDQLTPYEQRKLTEVARRHRDHSCKDLIRITHDLPEWVWNRPDPEQGILVRSIPLMDVVKAVGRGKDADWIFEDASAAAALDELLGK
ncbi:MAG TPA: Panacea domain-containing protein [Gemmataceae bacterium]|jgi:uncharacterized phage-associated protein|nr:Panacea domain-containing protein [Gemmataceae bacterium]